MVLLSPESLGPISTPWMVVLAASTKMPSVPKLLVASVVMVACVRAASVDLRVACGHAHERDAGLGRREEESELVGAGDGGRVAVRRGLVVGTGEHSDGPTDGHSIDGRLDGLLGIRDAGATIGIVAAGRVDVAGGRAVGCRRRLELQVIDEETVAERAERSRPAAQEDERVDGVRELVGRGLRIVPEVVLPACACMNDGTVDGDGDDVVARAIDEVHVEAQRVRHRTVKTAGDLGGDEVGAARWRARPRLLDVDEIDGQTARLVLDAQIAHPRTIAAIGRDRHQEAGLFSAWDRRCDVKSSAEVILAGAAGEATIRRAGFASFVDEGLRERLVPEAAAGVRVRDAQALGTERGGRARIRHDLVVVTGGSDDADRTGAAPAILAVDGTVRVGIERDRRCCLSAGDAAEPKRQ